MTVFIEPFVIDENGITRSNRKSKTKEHAAQILKEQKRRKKK
jgi:hypothetical protein